MISVAHSSGNSVQLGVSHRRRPHHLLSEATTWRALLLLRRALHDELRRLQKAFRAVREASLFSGT